MTRFEFEEANNTFKAMCKKLRKEGKGQVEHKRSTEKGDIKRLINILMSSTQLHPVDF